MNTRGAAAVGLLIAALLIAASPGLAWVIAAAAVTAAVAAARRRRPIAAPGHVHAASRESTAVHEAGHVVAARAVGSRVRSAEVYDNGGGLVRWAGTDGTARTQVVNAVAFLRAGEYAAGTSAGCGGDRAAVRDTLRYLPGPQRSAALREGEQRARRIVASRRGEIRGVAARLNAKGRL